VKTASNATPSSCAVLCSNLRVANKNSCNIYYVKDGNCNAGILDNPWNYSKLIGTSDTLVEVRVLASSKPSSLGRKVKPGK
jgi:hypothetical protein